jgi:hypothetical protein
MGKIISEYYLQEGMVSIHLAYERDQWRTVVSTVINLLVE